MTTTTDRLPDITRPDAGLVLFSEWTVGTPERQRAAMDAAMAGWANWPVPEGLLSHTCFASTDGTTVRHHSQWTDQAALDDFRRTDPPERKRAIDDAVPGLDRHGLAVYELHRSYHGTVSDGTRPVPGCIVMVDIEFVDSDRERQRQWIDAVLTALAVEPMPGLIAAHFHTSTDGTRVVNYAEWTSEQAHQAALDTGPQGGVNRTDLPEWRRVQEFPGMRPGRFTRYLEFRSLRRSSAVPGA
jgi:heme-degrading monooxygenase HmoA